MDIPKGAKCDKRNRGGYGDRHNCVEPGNIQHCVGHVDMLNRRRQVDIRNRGGQCDIHVSWTCERGELRSRHNVLGRFKR